MERLREKFEYQHIGAEDYDLWLRLLFDNEKEIMFSSLSEPLSIYRIHSG